MRNPLSNKNSWGSDSIVIYARGLTYYKFKAMKESVERCHKLWGKKLKMNDMLYMLKIINYGELQKFYKGV